MTSVCSAVVNRPLSLLLAAILSVAALATAAHAAPSSQQPGTPGTPGTTGVTVKGSTIIRLDKTLFTRFTRAGGKLRAGKPAKATKTGAKFKVTSIALGSDGASYLLKHKGSLRLSTTEDVVTIANPTASIDPTTGSGVMTATLSGKRVKVASLQIDIGNLEQTGSGIIADNVDLKMTARLASELNRLLGTTFLTEGSTLGKASVNVVTDPS